MGVDLAHGARPHSPGPPQSGRVPTINRRWRAPPSRGASRHVLWHWPAELGYTPIAESVTTRRDGKVPADETDRYYGHGPVVPRDLSSVRCNDRVGHAPQSEQLAHMSPAQWRALTRSDVAINKMGCYWRAIAMRQRSSGVMRWSRSSALSSMSICTQWMRAGELVVAGGVVGADAGAGVAADVGGLVTGEHHRNGRVDATVADLVAVDVQGDGRRPWRDRRRRRRTPSAPGGRRAVRARSPSMVERMSPERVVAVLRFAVLDVEAPAGERAALGDDHALGTAVGHGDVRGDGVRLVLDHEHRVLADRRPMPPNSSWVLALDRAAADRRGRR